jgi:hypothetical protein
MSLGAPQPMIISLDQNFLWDFHNGRHQNAPRLYALIKKAVKAGRAICPVHAWEMVQETSLLWAEKRDDIFRVAEELNVGMAFRDFPHTIADETLHLIRPTYISPRLIPGKLEPPDDIADLGNKTRTDKENYGRKLRQVARPTASFAKNLDVWGVYHELMNRRLDSMVRLVVAIRDKGSVETGQEEWGFAFQTALLLLCAGICRSECDLLIHLICRRKWEEIPTLLWHSRLSAQIEFQKLGCEHAMEVNDYFDLTRLAVGLTYADVVLCDRKMSNLINNTRFQAPKHFAWETSEEAINYIQNLLFDEGSMRD